MTPIEEPLTFSVLTEIRAIEQLTEQRIRRVLPKGLTLSQFAVLNYFSHLKVEKSPAQLARAFQLTKGAMTNTITRLEAAGMITVRDDPADGRRKLISPTEAGLAMRERAAEAMAPVFQEIGSGIGREKLRHTLPALRDMRVFLAAE